MRAEHDLATSPSLDTSQHLGNEPYHLRMKRQLRLLEEQRPRTVENCPEQAHQSQSAVRESIFSLPRSLRTPMLVLPANVRGSPIVSPEFQFLQLRNGKPQ